MTEPRKYAQGTTVSARQSRAELEMLLDQHGATSFAVLVQPERSIVVYELHGRRVKQVVDYPNAADYETVIVKGHYFPRTRKPETVKALVEAEWRRRWRAQVLIVKAKLEIIASGGSTFEKEFLADTMLPNGDTVAEAMLPRIAEAYRSNAMPSLLLGSGGP